MSVYMLIEAKKVMDPEMYGEYMKKVPPIIQKFGGRYLARGGTINAVLGDWKPMKIVIVEFESMEKFGAWYNSPEYRAIAQLREKSAKVDAVVVEGL
ncbi:MAG TPA: DUF1330 domain-containing protein [Candidatus Omnitrophota bacterium]|nr:DUF1330 domain-containing protein [Candidatus Omnitrophota bacterium]HPS20384.1 DUF1330 domain-containing protein [Candidatus Omnitrophota bacterium]